MAILEWLGVAFNERGYGVHQQNGIHYPFRQAAKSTDQYDKRSNAETVYPSSTGRRWGSNHISGHKKSPQHKTT